MRIVERLKKSTIRIFGQLTPFIFNQPIRRTAVQKKIPTIKIGAGDFVIMAGPCSVENLEQMTQIATLVKQFPNTVLRGGAFKPRTSPHDFQGLGLGGLDLLRQVKTNVNIPIITEVVGVEHLPFYHDVDFLQIGARNMQNFELLKAVGKTKTPVLLKRGFANTLDEFLKSADYILSGGNPNVILCERGIRTFEPAMRNTLDLAGVAYLKAKTHLPVIVDPSHATGIASLVVPMALSAIMAGADGLMIEVHNDPKNAISDGAQSLNLPEFEQAMDKIQKTVAFYQSLS